MRQRIWLRAIVVSLVVAAPLAWVSAAEAAIGPLGLPDFTNPTVVGQVAPATYTISNNSTGAEAAGVINITGTTFIPSCGSTIAGCTAPDLGVFQINGPFVGTGPFGGAPTAGTSCPTSYTASVINPATGEIRLTPVGANPVLAVGQTCLVSFTTTTLRVPTIDTNPNAPGVQTAVIGRATATQGAATGDGGGSSFATVNRATPGLTTSATPTVPIGQPISDTATLTAPPAPAVQLTGTIVFTVFGPDDATCTGTPAFTSPAVTVTGAGSFPSGPFTPTTAGTYRWVATYSGDANFLPITTPCNAANENSIVTKATPALATTLAATAPPATLNQPIVDSATLSGLVSPTAAGTITFNFYGPNNATCTGTPAFTSTVAVTTGNGTYPSGPFTPSTVGSYQVVASYSGDANNNPIATSCNDPAETVAVRATPALTTVLAATPPPATAGNPLVDTATISGLGSPTATGTITFKFYGPDNANCSGTPVFTSTVTVATGNGTYASLPFTPTSAGSYQVVASYSGDVNNNAVTTSCGDPNETITVRPRPVLATTLTATGPATLGNPIFDTATISGLFTPTATGTITFNFYGPNNTNCSGTPIFVSTATVATGNGTYPSLSFTPAATGSYQVVASYSGDVNNIPLTTACGDPTETILVLPKPTIMVDKTASPLTRIEPGGTFTFNVVVTNSSVEPVRITSLMDDKYGDISTKGTCTRAIGTVLTANGGTFTCSFDGNFTGKAGDKQTDIVTVVGIGTTSGDTVTDNDDAVVNITNVVPTIQVDKTAKPESLPAPTGLFTFTVVVTNTSTVPLKITKLTDDKYGDLSTQGTCKNAIGTLLAPNGGKYTCAFDGSFTGKAGDKQTDVVTATAVDDNGVTVTDTDDAVVTLTPQTTKVSNQQVNTTTTPASTSTLPRTGSGAARLATLAAGLIMFGGLLLFASRWVPVAPLTLAGGLGSSPGPRRRRR